MGGRVGECLPEVVLDAPGILVGVQTELGCLSILGEGKAAGRSPVWRPGSSS